MILTFDIGTSLLKGGIFDASGVLRCRAEVPLHLSDREDPLMHEADANNWISALSLVTAQLELPGASGRRGRIEAVVVSGNGPTLVPVDAKGGPLDFAMTWLDRRGVEEARYPEYLGTVETYNLSVREWEEAADSLQAVDARCRPMVEAHNALVDSLTRILEAEGVELPTA